ncbi:MAG TPA: hypothetical protein EYH44_04250 [Thermoprotei archaeon]|nr:hypothetical protein [Thermoprotei archaeon]
MIVLGTGITGSGRAKYLSATKEYALGRGRNVDLIDVGPEMFVKASSLRVKIPSDKILDLDETALRFLRATVFEGIVHKIDKFRNDDSREDLYISLHMSFRWKKVLMPAFDYYYLTKVAPDVLVTVIDSVGNIRRRIDKDPELHPWMGKLTIKELLIWQDEEVFITKMVADMLDKHFYIIPFSNIGFKDPDPSILYDILYDIELPLMEGERPRKRRAYLSYPMTHVEDRKEFDRMKNDFLRRLRENNIVVFDPIMVEDHILLDSIENCNDDEVYIEEFDVALPVDEIKEAKDYIIDSTVYRDYRFIDQSDMVIVFYPTSKLSAGVLSEMNYGFTHLKKVYTYFTEPDISPFFRNYSNYISNDIDDLIRRIVEDFEL